MTQTHKKYDPSLMDSYIKSKPDASNDELYHLCNATTNSQKGYIRKKKSRLLDRINNEESPVSPSTSSPSTPSQESESGFIDDPDELLTSVAIRELNKPDPDPRWANILISCKKENITNKNQVLEQFKQLPTKALVSLLNKNLQEES